MPINKNLYSYNNDQIETRKLGTLNSELAWIRKPNHEKEIGKGKKCFERFHELVIAYYAFASRIQGKPIKISLGTSRKM